MTIETKGGNAIIQTAVGGVAFARRGAQEGRPCPLD